MTTLLYAKRTLALIALLSAATAPAALVAQTLAPPTEQQGEVLTAVYGALPPLAEMNDGPRVTGIISARRGQRLQVTAEDGTSTIVTLHAETEIRTRGGFRGIGNKTFDQSALINGLPVTVKTAQDGEGLVASEVRLNSDDRPSRR